MQPRHRPSDIFIISLLGALSVLTPFSIDMYLPAYQHIAADFAVPSAVISLTISSYFIGLALGQVFYGPLLDRFGRKHPLYAGLGIFFFASAGCSMADNIYWLIGFRFLQALGGCAAQVAALAMVRDFFRAEDCAKIISRLILFIAISPLLAPSVGGFVMTVLSWRAIFVILALISALILLLLYTLLPEGHIPDTTISLKPISILREYIAIARNPRFITFALSGAFSFAGIFAYVAGAPIIFMEGFHLSAQDFSFIFALLALGFIGSSQVNVYFLKKFTSEFLFLCTLVTQVLCGLVFVAGAAKGIYGLYSTLVLLFIFLSCAGVTYPNAAAIAIIPFTRNAGSASAMLGFFQLSIGSLISSGISIFMRHETFPIIAILAITSCIGLMILLSGRKRALASVVSE